MSDTFHGSEGVYNIAVKYISVISSYASKFSCVWKQNFDAFEAKFGSIGSKFDLLWNMLINWSKETTISFVRSKLQFVGCKVQ